MKSKLTHNVLKKLHRRNKMKSIINAIRNSVFELNLSSYSLGINEEFKLRPKIRTKATLVWETDNEEIAIVDNEGNITPKNIGNCNIICKKGNSVAKCNLKIEPQETNDDIVLSACKFGLRCKNDMVDQFCNGFEGKADIYGDLQIHDNTMVFTGNETLETNGVTSLYGFGTTSTLRTQRVYLRFKIDNYPAEGNTYKILAFFKLSKDSSTMFVNITSDGHIQLGSNASNISTFIIPTNEWVDLIICAGNVSGKGWSYKCIYENQINDFYGTGNVIWGTDITLGKDFVGEIEHAYVCFSTALGVEAFNDEKYKFIDDYILNNEFHHCLPEVKYGYDGRTRNLLDIEVTPTIDLEWNLIDNDKSIGLEVLNNDTLYYTLEELDADGYVTRIYDTKFVPGINKISLINDYNKPQRWYKHFRFKDNYSKKYLYDLDLGISTVDSTITNNNDGIPAYFHISPDNISSRVGKYLLMQPTFAPYNNYKDPRCEWKIDDESVAVIDNDGLITCKSKGYCTITARSKANPALKATATLIVKDAVDESKFPIIDIEKYNIVPNTEDQYICYNNMANIGTALNDYKKLGYEGCKLPTDTYYIKMQIDGVGTCATSINIPDNFIFDMNGSTFRQLGGDTSPDIYIFRINGADNSILKNGYLYGDRYTHDYGVRLNENPGSYKDGYPDSIFEIGCIDHKDGITLVDKSTLDGTLGVRTKDFINIPNPTFRVIPLWNTSMNTVDGGRAIVYWYNDNNEFLGYRDTGFLNSHTAPENATKMKIVIRSENRLDPVFCLTTLGIHYTYEFAAGINVTNSFNFEIDNMLSNDFQGDCMITTDYLGDKCAVNDLRILNCTFENSRRQGISWVSPQENCLVKKTKIGKINGTDPQCGVDFEAYSRNEKFLFDECEFYDNRKWDMVDCFSGQIEVRNSKFNGSIGLGQTSYNWYVHDNEFIYDDKYINAEDPAVAKYKIHNGTGCGLIVNNSNDNYYYYSICNNNYVDGKSVRRGSLSATGSAKNSNSICNNNIFYNATMSASSGEYRNNKHYNVTGGNDYGIQIYDSEFDNSMLSEPLVFSFRSKPAVIYNSIFKNCILGGIYSAEKSTFESSQLLVGNNTNDSGYPSYFKDCTLTNPLNMNIANYFPGKCRFENCEINLTRTDTGNVYYNHDIGFKNCKINFSATGKEGTNKEWLIPGYGGYRCAMWFENCEFHSEDNYPVVINTNNYDDNCIFTGSSIAKERTKITEFTMADLNGMQISKNTQTNLGMNILPINTLNVFLDVLPLTNQITFNPGATNAANAALVVDYPAAGEYTLRFYTKDGSNLEKIFNITII